MWIAISKLFDWYILVEGYQSRTTHGFKVALRIWVSRRFSACEFLEKCIVENHVINESFNLHVDCYRQNNLVTSTSTTSVAKDDGSKFVDSHSTVSAKVKLNNMIAITWQNVLQLCLARQHLFCRQFLTRIRWLYCMCDISDVWCFTQGSSDEFRKATEELQRLVEDKRRLEDENLRLRVTTWLWY